MRRPSNSEIEQQEGEAGARVAAGRSDYPGMTYEEGVSAALRWVLGRDEDPPMGEE